jgi:hypothetical protein
MDIETASLNTNEPIVRGVGQDAPLGALVRFTQEARISDVNFLLDSYQASIIDSRHGLFRLQFGNNAIAKSEAASLTDKLQAEKIVGLAVATPYAHTTFVTLLCRDKATARSRISWKRIRAARLARLSPGPIFRFLDEHACPALLGELPEVRFLKLLPRNRCPEYAGAGH